MQRDPRVPDSGFTAQDVETREMADELMEETGQDSSVQYDHEEAARLKRREEIAEIDSIGRSP